MTIKNKARNMAVRKAFTLVEILIVVIILGILAAIVLPRFSNASAIARASMLADDLRIMRMQTTIFKSQHCDCPPGYLTNNRVGNGDADLFVRQMTKASKLDGTTAEPGTPGFDYGPYLRDMTENPINGKSDVLVVGPGAIPAPDDSHGWIFQPSTMTVKAGCVGQDDTGKSFWDY